MLEVQEPNQVLEAAFQGIADFYWAIVLKDPIIGLYCLYILR